MDDAFLMSSFYPLSNLAAYLQGFFHRHWTFGNTLSQGFAWDQLHGKETHIICLFKAINCSNVGVIQRGQELSFPLKPCQPLGVFGELP